MINVTVIGFGHVGSALSLLLLNNQHGIRLTVMEPSPDKEGAFLDLIHGSALYKYQELHWNNDELFAEADFVFFTAGAPNIHGHSRLSRAKEHSELTRAVFGGVVFSNSPFIIVITNPVDIVTHTVIETVNVPSERVIGTGTFLDSVRLSYYLSTLSNHRPDDFKAYVFGEHGDSQFPAYSLTRVGARPILEVEEFTEELLNEAAELTRTAAFQIRITQPGTSYGVAKCAEMIMNWLLRPVPHMIGLSVLTNRHYRKLLDLDKDICISLPVELSKGGATILNDVEFSNKELVALRQAAKVLRSHIDSDK